MTYETLIKTISTTLNTFNALVDDDSSRKEVLDDVYSDLYKSWYEESSKLTMNSDQVAALFDLLNSYQTSY